MPSRKRDPDGILIYVRKTTASGRVGAGGKIEYKVHFPPYLWKRLQKESRLRRRSINAIVIEWLESCLADEEPES